MPLEALMIAGPLGPPSDAGAATPGAPRAPWLGAGPAAPRGEKLSCEEPWCEEPWWVPDDREPSDAELCGACPDPFAGPPDGSDGWLAALCDAELAELAGAADTAGRRARGV